jgi:hypothetical protein
MRALVVAAFVVSVLGMSRTGRGDPTLPPRLPRDLSCEEQCQVERNRDDAACDDRALQEADRGFCHQAVRARLDVCLRICED